MLIKYNNHLLRLRYNNSIKYPSYIFFAKYHYIYLFYDIRGEYLDLRQYFYYNDDLYFIFFSFNLDYFYECINKKRMPAMPKIHIAGISINVELEKSRCVNFIKAYLNILNYT